MQSEILIALSSKPYASEPLGFVLSIINNLNIFIRLAKEETEQEEVIVISYDRCH